MNSELIQLLVSTLVPVLLQIAEKALNVVPNPADPSWVAGLVNEVVSIIQKYIPNWLAPSVQEIEMLVAAEVEKLLAKV